MRREGVHTGGSAFRGGSACPGMLSEGVGVHILGEGGGAHIWGVCLLRGVHAKGGMPTEDQG